MSSCCCPSVTDSLSIFFSCWSSVTGEFVDLLVVLVESGREFVDLLVVLVECDREFVDLLVVLVECDREFVDLLLDAMQPFF